MAKKSSDKILIELKDVSKHYHMGENVVKAVDKLSFFVKEVNFAWTLLKFGFSLTKFI